MINSYLFPDSIYKDNLYYGFTMIEFVTILVVSIVIMFATIFISVILITLYGFVLMYGILNYKASFNQSLYIEIKRRRNYHKQLKEVVLNLGGETDE